MSVYIDPNTGKMSTQKTGAYNTAIQDYTPENKVSIASSNNKSDNSVIRYPSENNSNYKTAADDYIETLEGFNASYKTDREQLLDDRQNAVDAINKKYASLISDEQQEGVGRLGQTRAFSARSGLLGSARGLGLKAGTEKYNKEQIAAIEAQRGAEISNIFDRFYDRLESKRQENKNDILAAKEKNLEFIKNMQTESREDLKTLAQAGMSLGDLTNEEYTEILEQTGWSKIQLESYYNANKPKEEQVKYSYEELKNGTLARIGDDGSFEEVGNYSSPDETGSWSLGDPLGDGSLYWLKMGDDGSIQDFKKFEEEEKGFSLGQGQARYEFNSETGQYEKVAYNPKTSVGGDDGSSLTKDEKLFYDDVDNMINDLSSGKKSWGQAFNYIKSKYGTPDDLIDSLLDKSTWYEEGAYEKQEAERKKASEKAKEEVEAEQEETLEDMLSKYKAQNWSKNDLEDLMKKDYGFVPDAGKKWLKENY